MQVIPESKAWELAIVQEVSADRCSGWVLLSDGRRWQFRSETPVVFQVDQFVEVYIAPSAREIN